MSRAHRAYTIIEVALVLFLIGVLSATSVYMIGGSRVQGSDSLAQSTADAAIDAAVSVLQMEGSLANVVASRLAIEQPDVSFIDAPGLSTASSQASVAVASGVVAVAVRADDGACWMLRASLLGDSSQPLRRYAISPTGSRRDCSGTRAMETSILPAAQGRGLAWSSPIVWGQVSSSLTSRALVLLRASNFTPGAQILRNEGTAGSALDATLGLSAAAGSDDPAYLSFEGTQYAYVPGASGNVIETPASAQNQVTSQVLDLRVRVSLANYSAASRQTLLAKWQTGSRGWSFQWDNLATTSPRLSFWASPDGVTHTAATASEAIPFASNATYWLRALKSGTTVSFFYAPDQSVEPNTWTAVGSAQTVPSTMFASSAPLTVGAQATGDAPLTGRVYNAVVRTGTSTAVANRFDPASCDQYALNCSGANGESWSITRASSGAQIALVTRPTMLFSSATQTSLRTPASSTLDIGSSADLTVVLVARVYNTPANSYLVGRLNPAQSTTPGWTFRTTSVQGQVESSVSDTSATLGYAQNALTQGKASTLVARFEPGFKRVTTWVDSSKVASSGSTTWSGISSALPLIVGASANPTVASAASDLQFYALAVFPFALSDTDVTQIASELAN
jgi:hypothetical protein